MRILYQSDKTIKPSSLNIDVYEYNITQKNHIWIDP